MPPQQSQSSAAMAMGALANMSGNAGALLGGALGLKNPSDLYIGMLKGSTVADRMIERFGLAQRFGTKTMVDTREELADVSSFQAGRDGLISIEVEDRDPRFAAAMANAYVEELTRLTQQLAVTEAAQRRLFFEKELVSARANLANAEGSLRATQEKTGLIQLDGQAKAIFEAFAELSSRIAAKQVELASIRTFATTQNPGYLRALEELQSLEAQLKRLERSHSKAGQGNILVPTTKVPEAGLEFVRRFRDVKHQEALYELLVKQLELAKIEEAKDSGLIQVLDQALPPDRKSRPKRLLLLIGVCAVGLVLGLVLALIMEMINNTRRDPEGGKKLAQLHSHLRG
jgi:uncharacterized protein involved in exopolysaccharide biosynthesis